MKTQQQRDEDNDKGALSTNGNKTETIPLDIAYEILKRLSMKSVLKFRWVSKQWCSITRSRSLTDYFMSLSQPRLLLGYNVHLGNESQLFFLSSPLFPQELHHSSILTKHNMLNSRISPSTYMGFCNSVRGIICISLSDRRILLCNPTTGQVVKIPNDLSGFDPCKYHSMCLMCLGYDKSKYEYKILRRIMNPYDGSVIHSVCTLERGQTQSSFSSWRHVESDIFYYYRNTNVLCINGVVYYGAGREPMKSFVVVSFDVGSERLLLIEPPKEEDKLGSLISYLGKLACFFVSYDNSYTLWVLDDVKNQIWSTKTCVLSPSFCGPYRDFTLTVIGTTGDGEIVFAPSIISRLIPLQLFIYDLKKNKVIRRFGVEGIRDHNEMMCSSNVVRQVSISCDHVDNILSL